MNYVSEYYKKTPEEIQEKLKGFFGGIQKSREVEEEIIKLEAAIKQKKRAIADDEQKIRDALNSVYEENYIRNEYDYVLVYNGSRDGKTHRFDMLTGLAIEDYDEFKKEHSNIVELSANAKEGTYTAIKGFLPQYGAIIGAKYNFKINQNYTKANPAYWGSFIIDGFTGRGYSEHGYAIHGENRGLSAIPFLSMFYGAEELDCLQPYNFGQLWSDFNKNKAFEIIVKTAPASIKKAMLNSSFAEAMPVHKLIDFDKALWDKVVEDKMEEMVWEMRRYIQNPIFNKTKAEWVEYLKYAKEKEEDLGFFEINTYWYGVSGTHNCTRLAGTLAHYYEQSELFQKNYSFGKFSSYVIEETINQGYTSINDFVTMLKDYLRACNEQDAKPTLFTSYLKITHDIANRNYKIFVSERDEKKFAEQYKDDKPIYYEGYAVIPPKSTKEVKMEGNKLNHCVGSYLKRIINGETKILFLRSRRDVEEPLVTFEVRNGAIVQAKGASNRRPTEAEIKALRKYAEGRELKFSV